MASVNAVKATITPAIQKRCHEIFPPHRMINSGRAMPTAMRWLN
jgi:hypothetical protein